MFCILEKCHYDVDVHVSLLVLFCQYNGKHSKHRSWMQQFNVY